MDKSERIERRWENHDLDVEEIDRLDDLFADRIAALLNHDKINKHSMVDAYYYNYSAIPWNLRESLNLFRDSYLLFGITTEAEIVFKWVDRWDLDSDDPIVDGKVIHSEKTATNFAVPEIKQLYDPKLLSYPMPECLNELFKGKSLELIDNDIQMDTPELCDSCKTKALSAFMKASKENVIKEYNNHD